MSDSSAKRRASRVKLLGTVLALIQLDGGKQVRARLHQLSANGGVLSLPHPLELADKVQLVFHVGSTTVRGQAEMLDPLWSTKGCLQPFRFTDLGSDDRAQLEAHVRSLLERTS